MPATRALRLMLRASCQVSRYSSTAPSLTLLAANRASSLSPRTLLQRSVASSQQTTTTIQIRHASSSSSNLKQTPLYDMHTSASAKMVPFANFSMPLTYADQSQTESHHWTRNNASLFDVSHMVQHKLSGPSACRFLETITPSAISSLGKHQSTLSVLLDEHGGIVDDTVITRLGRDSFYFVTNAGCREGDLEFIKTQMDKFFKAEGVKDDQITWHILDHHSLVALQGPKAKDVLQPLVFRDEDDADVGMSDARSYFLCLVTEAPSNRHTHVSHC